MSRSEYLNNSSKPSIFQTLGTFRVTLFVGIIKGSDYNSCNLAMYFPRMSNSRLTTVPTRMSEKLVCSKV